MRTTIIIGAIALCWMAQAVAADQEGTVKKLVQNLGTATTPEAQIEVIDELGAMGHEAGSAASALTKLLGSKDPKVRWHAERALASMGQAAKEAVPSLIKSLQDEDPHVRAYAAYALGRIGSEPKTVIPKLVQAAGDKNELVRRAAILGLREIGASSDELLSVTLKALEDADPQTIVLALQTIAGEGEAAIPRLCEALEHPKAAYWACQVIQQMGPKAAPAVDCLGEALDKNEPELRIAALLALAEIGSESAQVRPKIVGMLDASHPAGVHYAATYALGKIGLDKAADQALARNVQQGDDFLKMLSAWALAKHHGDDKTLVSNAVKLMVQGLKSKDDHLRSASARALTDFEGHRDVVIPALVESLKDASPEVAGNAADALAAFGAKAAEAAARQLDNKDLRFLAIRVIQRVGPDAASTLPQLIKALETTADASTDAEFHREVQFALGTFGPAAKPAVPRLVKSLGASDPEIQASAAYALGKIGPGASEAVPALRQAVGSNEEVVQRVSVWALLKITPDDPKIRARALPLLMKGLSSERILGRVESALALGDFGDEAKAAIPKLKELADSDQSPEVRRAAAETLKRLGN